MRRLVLVFAALLLAACDKPPAPQTALPHDAYIWQRSWRQPVKDAVLASTPQIRAWHVLAGEIDAGGHLQPVALDIATLAASGRPVVAVVRIEMSAPGAQQIRDIATLKASLFQRIHLAGLEIDHDSGSAHLDSYAEFLRLLRDALGKDVPLSATLLPDWLDSPQLPRVLDAVDESVLQLHWLDGKWPELFDAELAMSALRRLDKLGHPYRIALPDYGARIIMDGRGRIVGIENEMPLKIAGPGRELYVPPPRVADFLGTLRKRRPAHLQGVVWFRLPVDDDRRAWSRSTWHAVMRGEPLDTDLRIEIARNGDVYLRNAGLIDAEIPNQIGLQARCTGTVRPPYELDEYAFEGQETRLQRTEKRLLRAGATLPVARLKCDRSPAPWLSKPFPP